MKPLIVKSLPRFGTVQGRKEDYILRIEQGLMHPGITVINNTVIQVVTPGDHSARVTKPERSIHCTIIVMY